MLRNFIHIFLTGFIGLFIIVSAWATDAPIATPPALDEGDFPPPIPAPPSSLPAPPGPPSPPQKNTSSSPMQAPKPHDKASPEAPPLPSAPSKVPEVSLPSLTPVAPKEGENASPASVKKENTVPKTAKPAAPTPPSPPPTVKKDTGKEAAAPAPKKDQNDVILPPVPAPVILSIPGEKDIPKDSAASKTVDLPAILPPAQDPKQARPSLSVSSSANVDEGPAAIVDDGYLDDLDEMFDLNTKDLSFAEKEQIKRNQGRYKKAAEELEKIRKRQQFNYKTQILPEVIYNNHYSSENQHLPKPFSEEEYRNALFTAASKGNINDLRALLSYRKKGMEIKDQEGNTPLLYAVMYNQMDAARLLIARGANVNASNKNGTTALHMAAYNGQSDLAEILSSSGASFTAKDRAGNTPLSHAIKSRSPALVQSALAHSTVQSRETLLLAAATSGDTSLATMLLKKGVSINARDDNNDTPLIRAVLSGQEAMVSLLLKHNANVHLRNHKGQTALDIATEQGNYAISNLLLDVIYPHGRPNMPLSARAASTPAASDYKKIPSASLTEKNKGKKKTTAKKKVKKTTAPVKKKQTASPSR